jgi:hypothetical protein
MKKLKVSLAMVGFALAAFLVTPNNVIAETTIKMLHSAPKLVINRIPASGIDGAINDATDATLGISSVVDLVGGDLEKIGFAVKFSSNAGSGTLTMTPQVSPDNGTTYVDDTANAKTMTVNAVLLGGASYYSNIGVTPGTKMRIKLDLTSSCTIYSTKVWVLPSAQ